MATTTAPVEVKTARHFGTSEQTLAEAVNLVRSHLKYMADKDQGISGGIYKRMFNYMTKSLFTKVEFVEDTKLQLGAVNYAKYQVRQALLKVRTQLKADGKPYSMDISMIINHFDKY